LDLVQTTVNQSTSFLIGLVPYKIRYRTLLYVGHQGVQAEEWGEYLYIKGSGIEKAYAEHGISVDIIDLDEHLYRVKVDEKTFHTIVHPFLSGKYSQMDKGYINKTFSTGNSGMKFSSVTGFQDSDVGKSLQ